jgi:putative transposase
MDRKAPKRQCVSRRLRSDRPQVQAANERGCLDCVSDQLVSGHPIRVLTIGDICTRDSLALHVGQSIRGYDVVATLDTLLAWRDKPKVIQVDNGSECTSRFMDQWACLNRVELEFSRPSKPKAESAVFESALALVSGRCSG